MACTNPVCFDHGDPATVSEALADPSNGYGDIDFGLCSEPDETG